MRYVQIHERSASVVRRNERDHVSEVVCDLSRCGTKTTIKILSSEDDMVDGGSIISKGNFTVFNTIEARLERQEEALRDKVHKMIFIS